MTDIPSTSNTIRSELVDIATEFLKNPRISSEQMERKRKFLQEKGLTDTEINYAFQLVPEQGLETRKQIITNHRPSFLRRFLNDLIFSGFLVVVIRIIKQFFRSDQSNQKNELYETIKNLQKFVQNMQTSIVKLEQTADQLNLTMKTSNSNQLSSSSIEEIKREIQGFKELSLNRSQFSRMPTWQSKTSETITTNQTTSDNDNDGIIVISEQDKKSDEE